MKLTLLDICPDFFLFEVKLFNYLTLAAACLLAQSSAARADLLVKDGTLYSGRVLSLNTKSVKFDFDCNGSSQSLPLEVGMALVIDFNCEINAPPEGSGGTDPCNQSPMPEQERLFYISYNLTYQGQHHEGFGIFDTIILRDSDFGISEEDLNLSEYHRVGITVVPGDACVPLTPSEINQQGIEPNHDGQLIFRLWGDDEVVDLCSLVSGC